jgi:hypothetical protein
MQALTLSPARGNEAWILGGLTFLVLPLTIWWDFAANTSMPASYGMVFLALFSMPHYLESFQIFYRDKAIRQHFWFRGAVLPLMFVGLLGWFAFKHSEAGSTEIGGLAMASLTYHFAMQSFGAARYLGFDKKLKWFSWLAAIWCFSQAFFKPAFPGVFSLVVYPMLVPETLVLSIDWAYAIGLSWVLLVSVRQQALRSVIPFIALTFWFMPIFNSGSFGLIVPVFHALQFGFFARLRNDSKVGILNTFGMTQRYVVYAFAGVLFYLIIPNYFVSLGAWVANPSRAFAATWMFLVVHHVSLEGVIWRPTRSSNSER